MTEVPTRPLPVLPLKNTVVFPHLLVPLAVGRPRSLRLLDDLPVDERVIGVAAQYDETVEDAAFDQIHHVGTKVQIQHLLKMPDGTVQIAVQGVERIVLHSVDQERPYLRCDLSPLPEAPSQGQSAIDTEALTRSAQASFQRLVAVAPYLPADLLSTAMAIEDQIHLAYFLAHHVRLTLEQRQEVLELDSGRDKLRLLLSLMAHELEVLEVGRRIQSQAEESIGRSQREYFLREQQRAIARELGEVDQEAAEAAELRDQVEASGMTGEARREADRELARLERIPSASPESSIVRTYIEILCSLPWQRSTAGELEVARARRVLDRDHWALEKVKQRIVEHLAVRRLRADRGLEGPHREPILCFVGPPGVGKTSLGESVARAMDRKFVRVALGGVRDEAEIRGHRRTYVGALPGRIVRAIREAGTMNPVVLLDEVDKIGSDYRGDPAAALLEVLDPAQNHTFRDHYLEVDLDLSDVVFLATANVLDSIPGPLLDRMELVQLDGYTEDEKVAIGRDHLLPRQLSKAGLESSEVIIEDDALRLIAAEYTREAGVRSLERAIARVLRKVTAKEALETGTLPVTVSTSNLKDYLGRPRFTPETKLTSNDRRTAVPGVATGLAVTGAGGDVLYIEASLADAETGATGVTLTGQLGDVMKESAQIALSYLRSRGAELELPVTGMKDRGVHVHVPAGAVPKDGPSAGVTMTTALASLLSGRPVRADVAMTGEVSLTGRVLPIGGVKQKLLAAHRAGITTVLIPQRNEPDLDDVPAEVLAKLDVHPVSDVREVLALALEPATVAATAAA